MTFSSYIFAATKSFNVFRLFSFLWPI